LLGEHAVVYGKPALVVGISPGAEATVTPDDVSSITVGSRQARLGEGELGNAFKALMDSLNAPPMRATIDLKIPAGCGLGASAAAAVALARAAIDAIEPAESESEARKTRVLLAADAWEKVFHGNPSGIDAVAAFVGGCFVFTRGGGPKPVMLKRPIHLAIAIADAPADTRSQVTKVAGRHASDGPIIDALFERIRFLVEAAQVALLEGTVEPLGSLMNENHRLLQQLGVSTERLDSACEQALKAGALGAKLTGSGGGGCVVALCAEDHEPVMRAWTNQGLSCFSTTIGPQN
jgi:mevalonate kinase